MSWKGECIVLDSNKPSVLIVDDVLGNIRILEEILAPLYRVSFVTRASDVLETARREIPDLILLDIMMPEMDGFEVCALLKAEPQLSEIPVIFLSALDASDSVVKGFDLGAVDYVTKPYYPAELLTRMETHLKLKQSKELIAQKNRELAELIQILCHDYKTPISFALGSLELIRSDRALFDTFEPHIYHSLNNAIELIDLVKTLLTLDDAAKEWERKPVALKRAVDKAIRLLEPKLAQKGIQLSCAIPEEHQVLAEEVSLINSVINNLLSNAIKFSYPQGEIALSSIEENDGVLLTVKDSGIGMTDALLNDLFVVNRATSRKGTDGEKGTGYGMLLIKKFVDLYKASITITSRDETAYPQDHGTTVRIEFEKAVSDQDI